MMNKIDSDKVYIGTHNSMSYLKPKYWYLYPLRWFAKCQNTDIYKQLEKYNIVDLRVYLNKDNEWQFRHGLVTYEYFPIYTLINYINNLGNKIVRLIFDDTNCKDKEYTSTQFITFCNDLETEFKNIIFIGGNRKSDWKQCYEFNNNAKHTLLNQFVSSIQRNARWYEKLIPWFYAKRMNDKNINNITIGFNIFDFI